MPDTTLCCIMLLFITLLGNEARKGLGVDAGVWTLSTRTVNRQRATHVTLYTCCTCNNSLLWHEVLNSRHKVLNSHGVCLAIRLRSRYVPPAQPPQLAAALCLTAAGWRWLTLVLSNCQTAQQTDAGSLCLTDSSSSRTRRSPNTPAKVEMGRTHKTTHAQDVKVICTRPLSTKANGIASFSPRGLLCGVCVCVCVCGSPVPTHTHC